MKLKDFLIATLMFIGYGGGALCALCILVLFGTSCGPEPKISPTNPPAPYVMKLLPPIATHVEDMGDGWVSYNVLGKRCIARVKDGTLINVHTFAP